MLKVIGTWDWYRSDGHLPEGTPCPPCFVTVVVVGEGRITSFAQSLGLAYLLSSPRHFES